MERRREERGAWEARESEIAELHHQEAEVFNASLGGDMAVAWPDQPQTLTTRDLDRERDAFAARAEARRRAKGEGDGPRGLVSRIKAAFFD